MIRRFQNLNGQSFAGVDLRGEEFEDCEFQGTDFRGALIDETTRFVRCNLAGALFDYEALPRERNVFIRCYGEKQNP